MRFLSVFCLPIPSLLIFQQKSCENSIFSLPSDPSTVIMDNNAACGAVIVPAVGYLHEKLCQKQGFYLLPEGIDMAVSYKKLWKLLIDKDIKKKDLSAKAGVRQGFLRRPHRIDRNHNSRQLKYNKI